MTETVNCVFCDEQEIGWRTIRHREHSRSFVSNPRFRAGQSLVIPNRHLETVAQLNPEEASEIMIELGRLALILDQGFGSGIMQKYQPRQAENGIKVNHLHFHVFARLENESGLFPVPEPNSFDAFKTADTSEIAQLAESLR
jgi:histidine triad (HIT) family protein